MVGVLLEASYKYENVTLTSGEVINCPSITIANGKAAYSNTISVKVADNVFFSFSLKKDENGGSPKADIYNVPMGVDAQSIIEAFVSFVEADVI